MSDTQTLGVGHIGNLTNIAKQYAGPIELSRPSARLKHLRHWELNQSNERRDLHPPTRLLLAFVVGTVLVALQACNVGAQLAYVATITAQGLPTNLATNVYLDGALNGTLSGGQSRSFTFQTSAATHWITVDFYVPSSAGSGGVRYAETDTSWVFNAGGSHVFAYTTQFYLNVTTNFGLATGTGWYDSGSKTQAILSKGEIDQGPGIRVSFTGWGTDASGTGLSSNTILMDKPKTALANWKTQFLLTVKSDPQNVTGLLGSGWYETGAQASFSAPAVSQTNSNTRLRFDHWGGAYSGQSASGTLTMNEPKTIEAHYVAQYLLTIDYDPASIPHSINETSWHDANANVQLGPVQPIIQLSSLERLRFVAWIESGKQLSGLSVNLNMDQPHELTLSYITQYYVDVQSTYGQVTGSGWYDKGATARITAPATAGFWPFTYNLQSWRVDPPSGNAVPNGNSLTLTVDRPYTVEAVWSFDVLPIIAVFLGIVVAIVAGVGITLAYRRGMLTGRLTTLRPQKPRAPTRGPTVLCSKCGSRIPGGAVFCQKCGAPIAVAERPPLEDKVYDYIVKHEGVISLGQASKDLAISVDELKRIAESLKKKGRLA